MLEEELAALAAASRLRAPAEVDGATRVAPHIGGRPMLAFCTNDYLDLAAHPALAAAAAQAAARDGFGASASRLVAGDLPAHRDLETALAAHLGRPAALVFPTGYQANLGVLVALAGRDDLIVSDALNHASIVDGCRLSRARVAVYPHRDARAAARLLADGQPFRRRILVTESLFSMDGDVAPLADSRRRRRPDQHRPGGRRGPRLRAPSALTAAASAPPPASSPTSSSAPWASPSAPPAASSPAPRPCATSWSTAPGPSSTPPRSRPPSPPPPPPASPSPPAPKVPDAATLLAARCAWLADRLQRRRPRHTVHASAGPIFPIILGADTRALAVAASLRDRGFFVPAIRPPTVPPAPPASASPSRPATAPTTSSACVAALVEATR